ncbi:MAG: hypothetical protein ACOY0T_31115 [Myxococcota bacterium]
MIGKFIIPLAIGGGLLLFMSSSAKAEPSMASYDALPLPLRQLVVQAHATQDPAMFDLVANQLQARGYPDQARLLRMQGEQIRRAQPAPTSVLAPGAQPIPIQPSVDTNVPNPPSTPPFVSPIPSAPPLAPTASATPSAPSTQAPKLSPDLQKMVAEAIQNGTAPVLTSTAFILERAGFPEVAAELRRRATQAAATVPPPPPAERPNVALDPNMPPELALEVARQLQLQGDPAALETLARDMRKRGFNKTADQLEAKARQIRTMLDAAHTMQTIDTEFSSPGIVPPQSMPGGSVPAPAPAPGQVVPITVTATPPAPIPVPSAPQPQALPPERSKAQILAEAVATNLNDLIARNGSVPKARYKEDKALVQRFQSQEGLTVDGNYGPKSAERLARYVADVPPPFYWKKGAGQKDLSTYRSNIESLALDAEQLGNTDRAARLRASARKASLA